LIQARAEAVAAAVRAIKADDVAPRLQAAFYADSARPTNGQGLRET